RSLHRGWHRRNARGAGDAWRGDRRRALRRGLWRADTVSRLVDVENDHRIADRLARFGRAARTRPFAPDPRLAAPGRSARRDHPPPIAADARRTATRGEGRTGL